MKRFSWKYMAGIIDGEGCIDVQIRGGYCRPRMRIAMAEVAKEFLEACRNNFGGYISVRNFNRKEWNTSYCWEICGYKQFCKFMRNVVKHLILKKEQVRFCLWCETNIKGKQVTDEVRRFIRDELKAMKRDPHRLSEGAQERIQILL